MNDAIFEILFHPWILMWMGQALHLAKTLRDLEVDDKNPGLIKWIRKHPWSIVFSLLAGVVAYGFLTVTKQLTPIAAFMSGYMADSMVGMFTRREMKRLEDAGGEDVAEADRTRKGPVG